MPSTRRCATGAELLLLSRQAGADVLDAIERWRPQRRSRLRRHLGRAGPPRPVRPRPGLGLAVVQHRRLRARGRTSAGWSRSAADGRHPRRPGAGTRARSSSTASGSSEMGHSALPHHPHPRHRPLRPLHRQAARLRRGRRCSTPTATSSRRRGRASSASKSPTLAPGYWNDSVTTYRTRLDGYFLTGDLVYRDEDGYYYHLDRAPTRSTSAAGPVALHGDVGGADPGACPEVADCTVVVVRDGGTYRHRRAAAARGRSAASDDLRRTGPRRAGRGRRGDPTRGWWSSDDGRSRSARPARSASSRCASGTGPRPRPPLRPPLRPPPGPRRDPDRDADRRRRRHPARPQGRRRLRRPVLGAIRAAHPAAGARRGRLPRRGRDRAGGRRGRGAAADRDPGGGPLAAAGAGRRARRAGRRRGCGSAATSTRTGSRWSSPPAAAGWSRTRTSRRCGGERGRPAVSPYLLPGMLPNMAAARIAIEYGIRGYSSSICTACASGAQSIAEALRLIRGGEADVVVCGGQRGPAVPDDRRDVRQRPGAGPRLGRPGARRAGRSTGAATGSCWARAPPCSWSSAPSTPTPAAPPGTPTSPAGVPPPTRTTRPRRARTAPAPRTACAAPSRRRARTRPTSDYVNAHGTGTKLGDVAETVAHPRGLRRRTRPRSARSRALTGHLLGALRRARGRGHRARGRPRRAAADRQPRRARPRLRP